MTRPFIVNKPDLVRMNCNFRLFFYLTVAERQTVRTDPAPQDLSLKTRQIGQDPAGLVVPGRRIK